MKTNTLIFRSRILPISFRLDRRVPIVLLILSCVIVAATILNISVGEYPISPLAVVQTVLEIDTNPDRAFVINTLRLPRTLCAGLVGIALGISGAIVQGVTRNPLADPGLIGIDAGASLTAVSLIVLFPSVSAGVLPLAAFIGAAIASGLIYILVWDKGTHPVRLILVGVGIAAIANAFTNLLVAFGDIDEVSQALVWLAGSVYGRGWEQVNVLSLWLLVLIPLSLTGALALNALALGEETAKGLGTRIEWQRSFLLLIGAAFSGTAVAMAGTIGFVGLIAPHIARQLVGNSHQGLIPVAGLTGAAIVILADFLGRILFAPVELPCGIITSVIGVPYFVYLLVRNRSKCN